MTLLTAIVIAAGATPGGAATSSTVVGATVPSATAIDAAGCPSLTAGVTDFGSVTPGSSVRTTADCIVDFGSSNDAAALRVLQADADDTAFARRAWATRPSGTVLNLEGISMASHDVGWAVGSSGLVLETNDGGASWATIDIPGDGDPGYQDVHAVSTSEVLVASGNGRIYRSLDGGGIWTRLGTGVTPGAMDGISVRGLRIWAVVDGDTLHRSLDGGSTWTTINPPSLGAGTGANGVDIGLDGSVYVAFDNNDGVLRSTNDGATWATVWDPNEMLEAVSVGADGSIWAGGDSGTVGRSLDGVTWSTFAALPGASHIEELQAFDRRSAVVVGRSLATPAVATTVDSGATWTTVNSGSGATSLYGVSGTGVDDYQIAGDAGTIVDRDAVTPVPDWVDTTADWNQGATGAFGACLRDAADGAFADGTTWDEDTVGTANDCDAVDTDPWNPIGTAASIVARSPTGDFDAAAHLRFGLRIPGSGAAGDYVGTVRFEVVAPG